MEFCEGRMLDVTLRSVTRALIDDTNGFNEITIAPSFRSRNLGRRASFTSNSLAHRS
jgi:hypothetical protein